MKIGIIGGGAAGFMAAASAKAQNSNCEVTIIEKTGKLLGKVKVSGGGRCNVTNAIDSLTMFSKQYPRGEKQLKKAFAQFSQKETIAWFRDRGVLLKTEPDGRMFPVTDSSQTIIDCFLKETSAKKVEIRKNFGVRKISKEGGFFVLENGEERLSYDKILVATGGSPTMNGFRWLAALGHSIVEPVPSLFTFNMPDEPVRYLQGVAVEDAKVRIVNTKLTYAGPLLITHWGLSGPAILKLSAWGARLLAERNYLFQVSVSWVNNSVEVIRQSLEEAQSTNPKKKVCNINPFALPQRLWDFLLAKAELNAQKSWAECGKKDFNKLTEILTNDIYKVAGKTTFKDEFVTCGGIALSEVDFNTMESRIIPGLYFAGEVLDIDGITGGFNFQAAWTTGFIAGKNMVS